METPSTKNDKTEKPKKKKKLIGFPSIIWTQLSPLNESDYFKETYGTDNYSLLMIATDDNRAALIHFKDGNVEVEQIKKKNEDELNTAKKLAKAKIEASLETFMKFLTGDINPVKAILKRQLKIKGIKYILQFMKYFKVLSYLSKQKSLEN